MNLWRSGPRCDGTRTNVQRNRKGWWARASTPRAGVRHSVRVHQDGRESKDDPFRRSSRRQRAALALRGLFAVGAALIAAAVVAAVLGPGGGHGALGGPARSPHARYVTATGGRALSTSAGLPRGDDTSGARSGRAAAAGGDVALGLQTASTQKAGSRFAPRSRPHGRALASGAESLTVVALAAPPFGRGPLVATAHAANANDSSQDPVTVTGQVSPNDGGADGSVTASDSEMECTAPNSNTCTVGGGDDDNVTLVATAQTGWSFQQWAGDGTCMGTSPGCTITDVTASETDTADFIQTYSVSALLGAGTGTVQATDSGGDCTDIASTSANCTADAGDDVTITANPGAGYTYGNWSGADCGTGSDSTPCTFNGISSDESATANFVVQTYNVTASAGTVGGTVQVTDTGGDCSDAASTNANCTADAGDDVTITANPGAGYTYGNWSGANCGTGSDSTPCTFNGISSDESASATFIATYNIGTSVSGNGTLAVTDTGSACTGGSSCNNAPSGDDITITASKGSNATYGIWGGACSGPDSTPCTIDPLTSNATVTASFIATYSIGTSVSGSGTLAVTDTGGACTGGSSCNNAPSGDDITITATKGSGYTYGTWGGACSGLDSTPCTFNPLTSSETVTATFLQTYSITTTVGTGTGSFAVTDTAGDCTGISSCTAVTGDTITITPHPAGGYNFDGWTASGQCPTHATTNPCTFTATQTEDDTGNFVQTLTVSAGSGGDGSAAVSDSSPYVNCPGTTQSCTVDVGDDVTLTATPITGYVFSKWAGASGTGCGNTSGNPCTIHDIANPESDTATFVPRPFQIAGASGGNGTVTVVDSDSSAICSPPPSGSATGNACTVSLGDDMTLTATPDTGYSFSGWSGGTCTGTTNPCTFSAQSAETDTATFTPNQYDMVVQAQGSGSVTLQDSNAGCDLTSAYPTNEPVSCEVTYGDPVTIAAAGDAPNPPVDLGYHFAGWLGGGTCETNSQGATCSFNVTGAESDTATFASPAEFTIAVQAGPGGSATVSDANTNVTCGSPASSCLADYKDTMTLTATPSPGFEFASWSGDSCTATGPTCTISSVSANETVEANFALTVPGDGSTAVYVSPNGSDANAGTQSAPVATPQHALAVVEASGGTLSQIRIAQGTYAGPLSLTAADNGVGIYGGFDPNTWAPTYNAATPTVISGVPTGLSANGASGVVLQELDLIGHAQNAPSSSAYGAIVVGSQLTLNNVGVAAGNGTSGANGSDGAPGAAGKPGAAGEAGETPAQVVAACLASPSKCNPVDAAGGAGGTGANGNDTSLRNTSLVQQNPLLLATVDSLPLPADGPSAGDGGFGGFGGTGAPGTLQGCSGSGATKVCGPTKLVSGKSELLGLYAGMSGSTPADAPAAQAGAGGGAGTSSTTGDGHSGGTGTNGGDGTPGASGAIGSPDSPAGPAWTPGNGGNGSSGGPGAGGGGGGGGGGDVQIEPGGDVYGSGNAGGGGGGGGTGGTGGGGGGGGGGSFGIYLDGSSSITAALGGSFTSSNGGNGGNGGSGGSGAAGGRGGAGGTSGVPRLGAGGYGGSGGSGGGGGPGGAGGGGPSYASYAPPGDASSLSYATASLISGKPGPGGISGAGGGTPSHAANGASGACSGACPSMPLVLPALALISGNQLTTQLRCLHACHGTATLKLIGSGAALTHVTFKLTSTSTTTLHLALNSGGRAKLARYKQLAVQLTVVVTVGSGRPSTYVSVLELTRKLPPTKAARHPAKHGA
jgi:hypothetical protein